MSSFVAVLDTCVLYPAPLRDLLLRLALTDLFRARWTDRIHDEWIRSLLSQRPDLSRERLQRTRGLMDRTVPDWLVTGFEELIEFLDLPDPGDRHILAAAIRSQAGVIVTYTSRISLKRFSTDTESKSNILMSSSPTSTTCPQGQFAGLSAANAKHSRTLRFRHQNSSTRF